MKIIINIILSVVISLSTFVGAYKYLPLNWLETAQQSHIFGSTITTINGGDTLSSSRSVINTNFSNLNTDKIEATQTTLNSLTSASSLATVGTITSGVWSGTAILPAKGGTGSTTLSSNQILLGNGTGNIGIVSGWGASGQFLTSNGGGAAPTWQTSAVDQTANYNWTGTSLFKTLVASSTIQINNGGTGVSYVFPTSQGGAQTGIVNDGSGNLSWSGPPRYTYGTNTNFGTANAYATSTALNIPAGFITSSSTITVSGADNCSHSSGAASCTFYLRTGMGVTLASFSHSTGSSGNNNADINFSFKTVMVNSVSSQVTLCQAFGLDNSSVPIMPDCSTDSSSAINMANAFSLVLVAQSPDSATTPTVYHFLIEVNK